jgi:hypothetical protein
VGEQMDMNVLWELVNNLSEVHQGLREQTQGVLARVQMVQARQEGNGILSSNGMFCTQELRLVTHLIKPTTGSDAAAPSTQQQPHPQPPPNNAQSPLATELTSLRTALSSAESHQVLLTSRNHAAWTLLAEHESTLATLISKLRPFASSHATALAAQKAHYLSLLDAERTANLELRQEISQTQEGLGRALDAARTALAEGEKGRKMWRGKVAALRAENRVLASVCGVKGVGEGEGWESEGWDSSGDEDEGVGGVGGEEEVSEQAQMMPYQQRGGQQQGQQQFQQQQSKFGGVM